MEYLLIKAITFMNDLLGVEKVNKSPIEPEWLLTIISVGIAMATFSLAQYYFFIKDENYRRLIERPYFINFIRQSYLFGVGYVFALFLFLLHIKYGGSSVECMACTWIYNLSYEIAVFSTEMIAFFLVWYFIVVKSFHAPPFQIIRKIKKYFEDKLYATLRERVKDR